MRILFGIGNPGPEYAGTRHNLGFAACDAVAAEAGAPWRPVIGLQARGARVRLGPDEILLLKPMTYVNRCGPVLEQARARLGLELPDLLVVVDDLNLPLGRLRLRKGGSVIFCCQPGNKCRKVDDCWHRAPGRKSSGKLRGSCNRRWMKQASLL